MLIFLRIGSYIFYPIAHFEVQIVITTTSPKIAERIL